MKISRSLYPVCTTGMVVPQLSTSVDCRPAPRFRRGDASCVSLTSELRGDGKDTTKTRVFSWIVLRSEILENLFSWKPAYVAWLSATHDAIVDSIKQHADPTSKTRDSTTMRCWTMQQWSGLGQSMVGATANWLVIFVVLHRSQFWIPSGELT